MELLKYCGFLMMISFVFTTVSSNVLESEQSPFVGLSRPVHVSSSTLEAVAQLRAAVRRHARGDRRVRRFFDAYDTPFTGHGRRADRDDYAYQDY